MRPLSGMHAPAARAIALALLLVSIAIPMSACTAADEFGGYDEAVAPQRDIATSEYAGEAEVDGEMLTEDSSMGDTDETKATSPTDPSYEGERLVIRNVSLRIQVDDVQESVDDVRAATEAADGIVSMLNVSTNDVPVYREDYGAVYVDGAPLSGYITVRIPADNLDAFSESISELGKVLREDASQDDVTQQYVDLAARLENMQAREARLRELYDEADTVEDTLAVDRELSAVRGDIESMQAQILYLERQAAMATVTIELVEPTPIVSPGGDDWGFVDAVRTSLRAFMGTVNGLIIVFGAMLPVIILGLIVLAIVIVIVRSRKRRRARNEAADHDSDDFGDDGTGVAPQ